MQIPMIKIVADTVVNARFPFGRGVLPDYPVNFTPEELSFAHGDSILNYTQQLIREGKYIYYVEQEEEAMGAIDEAEKGFPWLWVIGGGLVLAGGVVLLGKKR